MARDNDPDVSADTVPRSLWRNGDFLLLWSGQAISTLGTQISGLALPLLVLALTRSAAQAGLIAAVQTLPFLIFILPAGALVDRWNRKRVMIRCDSARFLAYGSIPLAFALGHLTLIHLYAVVLVGGTALAFFNLAEVAALPRVVPAAHLPLANALNQSGESAAGLVGPGLAGFIISLARTTASGAALAYLVDSLSYLASVLSLGLIRTPFQVERVPVTQRSLRREIMEGLRFLWSYRRLRVMAFLTMSINLFFSASYLAVIVLARGPLHADARTIGLIFSLSSAGGLAGSVIAPWLKARLRYGQLTIGSVVLQALSVSLMAAAMSPAMLVLGQGLLIGMGPVFNVTVLSYRLTVTPDALQGRVNGVARLLANVCTPLGTAAGGLLLQPLGPRVELWPVAAGLGLSALTTSFTDVRRA